MQQTEYENSNILVVDDVQANLDIIEIILAEKGYNVHLAKDAAATYEKVNNISFDLILLDIMMPGIDGFEICTKLKADKSTKDIPVIFLTASAQTENLVKGFESGGVDYIQKPFSYNELVTRAETHIKLYQAQKLLHRKNLEMERKNTLLSDSIMYASRIQKAVLPSTVQIQEILQKYFLIYYPAHTLSGDFYWVKQIEHKAFAVVGDCTGHGVPGALMSMLAISFLNEAVFDLTEISSNGLIKEVNKKIGKTLHNNMDIKVHDTMDFAVCCINFDKHTIEFAGMNSMAFIASKQEIQTETELKTEIISSDQGFLTIIKGDSNFFVNERAETSITSAEFTVSENDTIYMFSDGYSDQIGYKTGKRYSSKRLAHYVLSINPLPVEEQKMMLENEFATWKGNTRQLDDVSIMGFKIQRNYGDVHLF